MRGNFLKPTILFLIITIPACQPGTGELLTPTLKHATSIAVTRTMEPAPTRKPTLTQTIPSVPGGCLPVGSEWPTNSTFEGYLYIQDQNQHSPFLIDLKTLEKTPMLIKNIKGNIEITPNGKWVAKDNGQDTLIVSDTSGKEITSMPYNWKSQRFHWLNNDELLIYDSLANSDRVPTLALNPFTGEKQKISRDYPNIFWGAYIMNSWAYSFDSELFCYDPTLHYVIYPLDPQLDETGFAVTDVAKHKIVARLHYPDMTSLPVWSPEGTSFVFASRPPGDLDLSTTLISDVLIGKPDGTVKTLVKMSDYFTSGIILPQAFYWSPNGRYILFSSDIYNPGWMVVDVQSKEVLTLCTKGTGGYGFVAWSPDSQYVAIASNFDTPMFLVDITGKKATQVDNLSPIGWLAK